MIESALLNGLSSAYNWRLRWSSWPKPSPSPRAVLIFQRSPFFEWTCSFLPQQASSSSLSSPSSTTMTDRKAVIKNADMSEDMQQDAVDCATQAMEKYNIEKDIAAYIKKVRQDGCMDGSKWSSVSLHHWHMICKFRAFVCSLIYFWSVWRGGSYDQGFLNYWGQLITVHKSPLPHMLTNIVSTSIFHILYTLIYQSIKKTFICIALFKQMSAIQSALYVSDK